MKITMSKIRVRQEDSDRVTLKASVFGHRRIDITLTAGDRISANMLMKKRIESAFNMLTSEHKNIEAIVAHKCAQANAVIARDEAFIALRERAEERAAKAAKSGGIIDPDVAYKRAIALIEDTGTQRTKLEASKAAKAIEAGTESRAAYTIERGVVEFINTGV